MRMILIIYGADWLQHFFSMNNNPLTPIACALLALGAASPAWAQPASTYDVAAAGSSVAAVAAPDAAGALMGVQRVEIEGQGGGDFSRKDTSLTKLPAELRDIPQSVTIIDKALMQSQGATSLTERAAQRARHHARRSRRRPDRQQHQPARLLGAHRHLPRRLARPRPVLPRHLRARVDRGADGSVLDAVRPRLDRRRDQPGAEAADAQAAQPKSRLPPRTNGLVRTTADINKPIDETRPSVSPDGPGRCGLDARRDEDATTTASRRPTNSASARRRKSPCLR